MGHKICDNMSLIWIGAGNKWRHGLKGSDWSILLQQYYNFNTKKSYDGKRRSKKCPKLCDVIHEQRFLNILDLMNEFYNKTFLYALSIVF